MQPLYNKRFRNIFNSSKYIDDYLEDLHEGEVAELASMGIAVTPRDENDVFVPVDKDTPYNLKMVEKTMLKAYGLEK